MKVVNMSTWCTRAVSLCLIVAGGLSAAQAAPVAVTGKAAEEADLGVAPRPAPRDAQSQKKPDGRYGKLPAHFEVNAGQLHDSVKFATRGNGYQLALTGNEILLSLQKSGGRPSDPAAAREWMRKPLADRLRERKSTLVRKSFAAADPNPEIVGEDLLPGVSHYVIGSDPTQWRTNVEHYAKVRYRNLYPGIDMLYHGVNGRPEYDWLVAPGADPHQIVEIFEGATGLRVLQNGDLFVDTADGGFVQKKPTIFQDIRGDRVVVRGGYVVVGANRAGFKVGRYDRSQSLVIDPVLEYSTLLDGANSDFASGVAVNDAGEAYIVGTTASTDFPHTATILSDIANSVGGTAGLGVAFVTKLNAAGDGIVFSTYFGSNGSNLGSGIALGTDGSIYATGNTEAIHTSEPPLTLIPGAQFPYTATIGNVDAAGLFFSGAAFVVKLAPDGSRFSYATVINATGCFAAGQSIAVDASGRAIVGGSLIGECADWFTTPDAVQTTKSSASDEYGFVLKLTPDGSSAAYSTLFGGARDPATPLSGASTRVNSIAADASGNAYFGGFTATPFLPLANPSQVYVGVSGGFFTKIDPTGSLVYSSYYSSDTFHGVALDGQGNALFAGNTSLVKVNQVGAVTFATAGPGSSQCFDTGGSLGIALDRLANIYLTGTACQRLLFPIVGDLGLGGGFDQNFSDAFVAKVSADGGTYAYSFPLGGAQGASGNGIAVDRFGGVYVVGSATANFPTLNPIQSTEINGAAFIAKFSEPLPPIGLFSSENPALVSDAITFTAIVPDDTATGTVTFKDGTTALGTVPLSSGVAKFTISTLPIAIHLMTAVYNGDATHIAATSSVFNQEVAPPPQDSLTVLSASAQSLPADQALNLTAIVTGTAGVIPTGLVMFLDGSGRLATAQLLPGTGIATIALKLTPGTHSVTARYLGDARNAPSTSAPPLPITVIGAPTVTITSPSGTNNAYAIPVSFDIFVTATSPTGATVSHVDLLSNGAPFGTLTSPPYIFHFPNAPPGTYTFSAVAIDNFFQSNTSAPVKVQVFDASLTFYHHDLQGNTIAATDGRGQYLYTENYRPFGDRVNNFPEQQVAQPGGNRQWFAGKAQDEATGLQYFGARYYDPAIGRFMGIDSVGFDESNLHSFNRFAYGNNNPYRYIDLDGKSATEAFLILGVSAIIVGNALANCKDCRQSLADLWRRFSSNLHNEAEEPNETPGTGGKVTSPGNDASSNKPSEGAGSVEKPRGIPENWREEPTKGEGGRQWVNPDNPNDRVRSMPGNPNSPHPKSREPYVRDVKNGNQWRDVTGNRIEGSKGRNSPDTHIPTKDYVYRP
jgi:RHS repeat-associated protein